MTVEEKYRGIHVIRDIRRVTDALIERGISLGKRLEGKTHTEESWKSPYVFTVIVRGGVGVIAPVALLPVKPLYLLVVLVIVVIAHSHSILGHDVLVNLLLLIRLFARALLLGILLPLLLQSVMMRLLMVIVHVGAVLVRRYEYTERVLTVHAGYTVD